MKVDDNTARLVVVDAITGVMVFSPFRVKDIMRGIPSRRWDPRARCWRIDELFVDMCADALRQAGLEVFVTHRDGTPYRGGTGTHGTRSTPAPDWVEAAFAACPPSNVPKLKKVLLTIFHPDAGGSADIARRIITAAESKEN